MKYTSLPKVDQPKNRIRDIGPGSLTTAEILAVSLGIYETEIAEQLAALLTKHGALNRIPRQEIISIKGLGEQYAASILSISELVSREIQANFLRTNERQIVRTPSDVTDLIMYDMSALDHEELWVVLLDTRNSIKEIVKLYKGTVNASTVRVGELFREAVKSQSPSIILVHNHPSGDPAPSPEDVRMTSNVIQAGKILDIEVLDHVVIGNGRYVSMKERRLAF